MVINICLPTSAVDLTNRASIVVTDCCHDTGDSNNSRVAVAAIEPHARAERQSEIFLTMASLHTRHHGIGRVMKKFADNLDDLSRAIAVAAGKVAKDDPGHSVKLPGHF